MRWVRRLFRRHRKAWTPYIVTDEYDGWRAAAYVHEGVMWVRLEHQGVGDERAFLRSEGWASLRGRAALAWKQPVDG